MKVAVIGQGYVGSALGIAAYNAGHSVLGIESDLNRLKELSGSYPYEVSSDYRQVKDRDVVVIAVQTPLNEKRKPDLVYLQSACVSLQSYLRVGTLVINESTSFPGTLRQVIAPILGRDYLFASAPERVDPANKKWNIENTPRLVAGLNDTATMKAMKFYQSFCKAVIPVSSPEVAEAAKLFENTFRQVNIALVNEFAQIAQAIGISAHETLEAASSKPFGFMSFVPSIGVGGHCIPVDPSYLSFAAEKAGVEASLINLANKINESMPDYVAGKISALFGSMSGKSVQIAGIAYKPNVSDTRESPALTLVERLRAMGAQVSWHDDVVGHWQGEDSSPLAEVDLGVIATAHSDVNFSIWKQGKTKVIDVSANSSLGWPKFL